MQGLNEKEIYRAVAALVFIVALSNAGASVLSEQTAGASSEVTGVDEFRYSCASCHGVDANGEGILAAILTVKPTDLTTLSKNNDGQFPETRVYQMIDGRESFYAHGDREMPVWGIRYLLEYAVRYGNADGEQAVRRRIRELVEYLRSIQE